LTPAALLSLRYLLPRSFPTRTAITRASDCSSPEVCSPTALDNQRRPVTLAAFPLRQHLPSSRFLTASTSYFASDPVDSFLSGEGQASRLRSWGLPIPARSPRPFDRSRASSNRVPLQGSPRSRDGCVLPRRLLSCASRPLSLAAFRAARASCRGRSRVSFAGSSAFSPVANQSRRPS